MFAGGLVGQAKVRVLNSGAETASFGCNITNYYFYFRFIAFVNYDIMADLSANAVAQLGGVGT